MSFRSFLQRLGVHREERQGGAEDDTASTASDGQWLGLAAIQPQYKYTPLTAPGQIRLVTLLPGRHYERVHCTITIVDGEADYTTLSYAWDRTTFDRKLVCDNSIVKVTSSCEQFLRTLRDRSLYGPYWIDALCIDQSNVQERNHEVARMGDIYAAADGTIIYLGPHDSHSAYLVRDPTKKSPIEEVQHWNHFVRRKWFSRTWIIQETLLSRKLVLLISGETLRATDRSSRAGQQMSTLLFPDNLLAGIVERTLCKTDIDLVLPDIFDLQQRLRMARSQDDTKSLQHNEAASGSRPSRRTHIPLLTAPSLHDGRLQLPLERLLEVMISTTAFACRDPRDKLFALISLFPQPLPELVAPSYHKTTSEVYTDAMWFFLQQGHWEALCLAGGSASSDLPSWVIDWRSIVRNRQLGDALDPLRRFTSLDFGPCSRDGNKLVMHGIKLATVLKVGRLASITEETEGDIVESVFSNIDNWQSELDTSSLDSRNYDRDKRPAYLSEVRRSVSRSSTVSSLTVTSSRSSTHVADSLTNKLADELSTSSRCDFTDEENLSIPPYERIRRLHSHGSLPIHTGRKLAESCVGRRLIVLEGNIGALGPANVRKGDVLCSFTGLNTPLLMCRTGTEWEVVGPCLIAEEAFNIIQTSLHVNARSAGATSEEFRIV